jgi:predicted dehydrogenase
VISTDEYLHVDPVLGASHAGLPMMIEKPLATDLAESQMVMDAIENPVSMR